MSHLFQLWVENLLRWKKMEIDEVLFFSYTQRNRFLNLLNSINVTKYLYRIYTFPIDLTLYVWWITGITIQIWFNLVETIQKLIYQIYIVEKLTVVNLSRK